jgi:hypothetical protein
MRGVGYPPNASRRKLWLVALADGDATLMATVDRMRKPELRERPGSEVKLIVVTPVDALKNWVKMSVGIAAGFDPDTVTHAVKRIL